MHFLYTWSFTLNSICVLRVFLNILPSYKFDDVRELTEGLMFLYIYFITYRECEVLKYSSFLQLIPLFLCCCCCGFYFDLLTVGIWRNPFMVNPWYDFVTLYTLSTAEKVNSYVIVYFCHFDQDEFFE